MDVREAAETLGISPGAVRNAVARDRLRAIRRGGTESKAGYLLFEKDEIERYRREVLGTKGKYNRKPKAEAND